MKVEIVRDANGACGGLMIVPESDFERDFLTGVYDGRQNYTAFLKTGLSLKDVIGLKIPCVGTIPKRRRPQ